MSTWCWAGSAGGSLGLFVGKQFGVTSFAWLVIRAGAKLPAHANRQQCYGVAILCGIGFTMSLFVGLLAFPTSPDLQDSVKLGELAGSILSALFGAALLGSASNRVGGQTSRRSLTQSSHRRTGSAGKADDWDWEYGRDRAKFSDCTLEDLLGSEKQTVVSRIDPQLFRVRMAGYDRSRLIA